MAGVGIFFQQEPTTARVYVANIVEGGSADRFVEYLFHLAFRE